MQKNISKQGGVIINIGDEFEENGLCYRVLSNGSLLVLGFAPGTTNDILRISDEVQRHIVSSIGANAFANTAIRKATLPNSVVSIEENAFMNCTELMRVVMNGYQPMTIKEHAFAGCSILQRVVSERSVTVCKSAFADCVSLTTFLPYVERLREDAFNGCPMLEYIDLSEVSSLEENALRGSFIKELGAHNKVFCADDVLQHIIQNGIVIEAPKNAAATELIHYGICVRTP